MILGLDLAILKTIVTDKNKGLRFSSDYNSQLFEGELKLFGELVLNYMKAYKDLPSQRTLCEKYSNHKDYINKIYDEIDCLDYNEHDFNYDLEKLKIRYTDNSLDKITKISTSSLDSEKKQSEIASILKNITLVKNGRTAIQKTVKEHLPDFEERYKAIQENPDAAKLFKTGFSAVDFATSGGLSFGELFIIGGETNAGKSIFLNTLARNMWLQNNKIDEPLVGAGANVMYFSLEMPYDDCFSRWIASVAGIPDRSVTKATLTPEELEKLKVAKDFIKTYPYEFEIVDVPRNVTVDEIELRFHDSLLKYTPDIVVVDYMGIMSGDSEDGEPDWLKLGNIAAGLHEFARAYNIIMLTAVQLTDMKRSTKGEGGKTEEARVGVHRVGRSSQIMHHANVAAQIDSRSGERNFADFKYGMIKNRKGPLANGTCKKNFEEGCVIDIPYVPNTMSTMSSNDNDISDIMNKLTGENQDE